MAIKDIIHKISTVLQTELLYPKVSHKAITHQVRACASQRYTHQKVKHVREGARVH